MNESPKPNEKYILYDPYKNKKRSKSKNLTKNALNNSVDCISPSKDIAKTSKVSRARRRQSVGDRKQVVKNNVTLPKSKIGTKLVRPPITVTRPRGTSIDD